MRARDKHAFVCQPIHTNTWHSWILSFKRGDNNFHKCRKGDDDDLKGKDSKRGDASEGRGDGKF